MDYSWGVRVCFHVCWVIERHFGSFQMNVNHKQPGNYYSCCTFMPTQCLQDCFLLLYHSRKVCSFRFADLNTVQASASQDDVILEGIKWSKPKFTTASAKKADL